MRQQGIAGPRLSDPGGCARHQRAVRPHDSFGFLPLGRHLRLPDQPG